MNKNNTAYIASLALCLSFVPRLLRAEDAIFDMDSIRHRPTDIDKEGKKIPAGSAELVDGKVGKAVKFTFTDGHGFFVAPVKATADWAGADGFSFWVKGDGSLSFGGIELIDRDNYSLRYGYCFPIDSTEWTKIVVPWRDVIPELAAPLLGKDGHSPANCGNFWFGKWFYWRDYPPHSYAIDEVRLEKNIAPQPMPPFGEGLTRVREKLRKHEPITFVTAGDSLSDERHWANRGVLWSKLLAASLKQKFGSEVTLVNPAMGGTTLTQNLILMPRWLKSTPKPDLVIVWFGYNDWDGGVRGPRFAEYLRMGVDRIRRMTGGSADVLLITTCPAHGRWETMKEMEQAVRDVAAEKKTGLADAAAEFRKAGTPDEALKREYWAWDKTHLGKAGHALVKDVVMKAMAGE